MERMVGLLRFFKSYVLETVSEGSPDHLRKFLIKINKMKFKVIGKRILIIMMIIAIADLVISPLIALGYREDFLKAFILVGLILASGALLIFTLLLLIYLICIVVDKYW